ncbi:MAG: tetratricopeptide repeat protein [Candidatus Krumholzibacteria bacterium]|nr:tetratricopeptide repeat protein [Candidatus Krumholzibacteria bacterium]
MARNETPKKGIHPAVALAAIVAAGLVVRLVFLVQIERSEFGGVLSLDSRFYYDLARAISAGGAPPAGALDFNPLYPAFLVVVFKLFGAGLLAPRIAQFALGLFTIALIYAAGARLVEGPRKGRPSAAITAIAAATMALLYRQFVLYEGTIIATALEVFLVTASFMLALALDEDLRGERPMRLRTRRIPQWVSSCILGALLGAGALGRPNFFLLLVAAVPVWILLRNLRKRRGMVPALSCLAGAALFLAPPIVYGAALTGRVVPVSAHGGINFYIGNRPGSTGVFQPPADMRADMRGMIEDAKLKAEAETGRAMTQPEVSGYYVRKALGEIGRDPAWWLGLVGRKFLVFFNGIEVPDVPNVIFYEKSCGVLAFLFLPFAVIAPLGLCGLVVLFRSGRNRSVVSLFLGCAIASVLLFFVNARYRLPAVPILILLAAFFVAWAVREISRRRLKSVAIMIAAALALFFLVSHRTMVRVNESAAYTFLGNYYIANKDEAKAAEAFAEAYRLDPEHVEAMINYARILRKRGEAQTSVDLYARAYALMPRFPRLAIEYGSALELLGRRAEARRLYEHALSIGRPGEQVLACRLLAQAALAEGRRDEAIVWVKRALSIAPDDAKLAGMLEWLEGMR